MPHSDLVQPFFPKAEGCVSRARRELHAKQNGHEAERSGARED
jgi:hypothetical protein